MNGLAKASSGLLTALLVGAFGAIAASAETSLIVYSSYALDDLPLLEEAFERAHPEIDIVFQRDSEGVIAARVLAEKDNRRADMVNGISAPVLMRFAERGMLEPYAPKGVERLDARFVDEHRPSHWAGMGVYSSLVVFNTTEGAAKGLSAPRAWADLADPVYAGQVLMPNPTSSDVALLTVAAWLRLMGEEKAWQFMDGLDRNVAQYTKSASKVAGSVATGEYTIGITIDRAAGREKANGAPIDVLLMAEGIGWNVDAFAILEGTEDLEAARAFADWSASDEAMRIYAKAYPIVAVPGVAQVQPGLPAGLIDAMIATDFAWMAANRERILAEWSRRYGERAE